MPHARPTLARRQLGDELRRLRQEAGLTATEAGTAVEMHRNTIVNIERGRQGTKSYVVRMLCEAYGAPPDVMSQLAGLVVKGKERGLWESHQPGMEPRLRMFAQAEQEYDLIHTWEPEYIPGLLQTREYHNLLHSSEQMVDDWSAERVWRFRWKRQERYFARDPMPLTRMLIGQAALRYLNPYPRVKAAQVARLRECSRLPAFEVRIVAGLHPAMTGAFTVLSPTPPPTNELAFVFIDALDGCRYIEDPATVSRYCRTFEAVRQVAVPIEEFLTDESITVA